MMDISIPEILTNVKNLPGSRHKFPGKREILKPKFPVSTSREETLLLKISMKSQINKILYALGCSTKKIKGPYVVQ